MLYGIISRRGGTSIKRVDVRARKGLGGMEGSESIKRIIDHLK